MDNIENVQEPFNFDFILDDPTLVVEILPSNVADGKRLAYVGSISGPEARDSNAWFTPDKYLTSVRAALGGRVDLDPFSSAVANKVVDAENFYSVEDDAFTQDWAVHAAGGSVYMNPPYGSPLCARATAKFVAEFEAGSFAAGVILVNNATDTKWFHAAVVVASAMCLTDHRIAFWNADGKKMSGNTRGQAFLYFGDDIVAFGRAFAEHGHISFPLYPTQPTTEKSPTFILAA
jgi:phage N-6-adenine-methyltransferase